MALIRTWLLCVYFGLILIIKVLFLVVTVKLVLRWPTQPPQHAAHEVPLPVDPHAEDWAAWEDELRQSEEADGA